MSDRVPSLFVLVPGPWRDPEEVADVLTPNGIQTVRDHASPHALGTVQVQLVEDDRLAAGFTWGRRGPLSNELQEQVRRLGRAALLECRMRLDEKPREVATLGRILRDAGGVAIRMEASGAATAWEPWLADLESGDIVRVYQSSVLIVDDGDGLTFTCGMHQFGLPDAQVTTDSASKGIAWLDAFCAFQLVERPTLLSGHTFRPHPKELRLTMERWPDHRHHATDGRHNPFGVWRLQDPSTTTVEPSTPVLAFVPSLVASLIAAERRNQRPLTQSQVERIASESAVIAMEPASVSALERSRGYADIEPELAWEQWQVIRAAGYS